MDWIFGMGIQPRGSPRTRDRKCISAKKEKNMDHKNYPLQF